MKERVYIRKSEQEQKLAEANCEIIRIPEYYYYRDELIETGDI